MVNGTGFSTQDTLVALNKNLLEVIEVLTKNDDIIHTISSSIDIQEQEILDVLKGTDLTDFFEIKNKIESYFKDVNEVYYKRVPNNAFKLGETKHNEKINHSINWVIGQENALKSCTT